MKYYLLFVFLMVFVTLNAREQSKATQIQPGKLWNDLSGNPINAHGGGILYHGGIYYWYGTHKIEGLSEKTFADGGIHCYTSTDLVNWADKGLVLPLVYNNDNHDLAYQCNFDRPKVVYNTKTKKFVAFFKLYLKGQGVTTGYVGVALSDNPLEPFTYSHKFLGAASPNGSGDYAMFQEENGDLYHLTVRKPDKAFVVGKMRDDYLMPEGDYSVCEGITEKTEGPAIVKRNGIYHLLGSGSTGWDPNPARYFTSKSLAGPWVSHGNPCEGVNPENGLGKEKTFGGQSTFIIPVYDRKDAYIAVFDINQPENPYESRHIWLPVSIKEDKFLIAWRDSWNMDSFGQEKAAKISFADAQSPSGASPVILTDSILQKSKASNWELVFSDEFNDNAIDTSKWSVETGSRKRTDLMLLADENQVEEKEGKLFIYYRKSPVNDTTYLAGRVNSKGKYAPTYGFLECRMHIVKPNGHQMAFWMMPEGTGMKTPQGVDGTANDGAEIDIIEGTKANAYSLGLHWDGYAKPAHKSNGALVPAPNMHDQEYHVYGFEWSPTYLKFYYDGKVVREMTDPKLIPHVAEFIYFSGSCFGENNWVDGDVRKNEFIQNGGVDRAYVDYVRVYKNVIKK